MNMSVAHYVIGRPTQMVSSLFIDTTTTFISTYGAAAHICL